MQATVPIGPSNRQAREERLRRFGALAAYANLGDSPANWRDFCRAHPGFFPQPIYRQAADLAAWLAEAKIRPGAPSPAAAAGIDILLAVLSKEKPELRSEMAGLESILDSIEGESAPVPEMRAAILGASWLLWYRGHLRRVWTGNDPPDATSLRILYGLPEHDALRPLIVGAAVSGGEVAGLPSGQPVVDAATGAIRWEFACELQQAVYDLMEERWRAKVCPRPECGKYFIAAKTASKYCSTRCYRAHRAEGSLEDYYRRGRFRRQARKEARRKKTYRGAR